MTDGLVLPPGEGRRIQGAGMTLKVGAGQSGAWSAFEAAVTPGFDVGAHLHREAEELFYILDGELDLLAFEPVSYTHLTARPRRGKHHRRARALADPDRVAAGLRAKHRPVTGMFAAEIPAAGGRAAHGVDACGPAQRQMVGTVPGRSR